MLRCGMWSKTLSQADSINQQTRQKYSSFLAHLAKIFSILVHDAHPQLFSRIQKQKTFIALYYIKSTAGCCLFICTLLLYIHECV